MTTQVPESTIPISQYLLRGYQFSISDLDTSRELSLYYTTLDQYFDWFQKHMGYFGFTLKKDDGIIYLEKEGKSLSNEEKQAVVALYLLLDLWLEQGKAYQDLFELRVSWQELEWFRDGYGREYLAQVGIDKEGGRTAIEDLWKKLERRGIVDYETETNRLTLRRPAERLYMMAQRIHTQITAQNEVLDES